MHIGIIINYLKKKVLSTGNIIFIINSVFILIFLNSLNLKFSSFPHTQLRGKKCDFWLQDSTFFSVIFFLNSKTFCWQKICFILWIIFKYWKIILLIMQFLGNTFFFNFKRISMWQKFGFKLFFKLIFIISFINII